MDKASVGALTKYFGHGNQGWKIRGIELRQHSTCTWIRNLQIDALEILRPNPSISAQRSVVSMLHERIADLRRGAVPLQDLITARRVNRSIEDSKVVILQSHCFVLVGFHAKYHLVIWCGLLSLERVESIPLTVFDLIRRLRVLPTLSEV